MGNVSVQVTGQTPAQLSCPYTYVGVCRDYDLTELNWVQFGVKIMEDTDMRLIASLDEPTYKH